jgi:hypothetical protein
VNDVRIKSRPRSIEQMFSRMAGFNTEESRQQGLGFQPEDTDIFISPFSKCGTTWLQQIVNSLRTGGSMDFDEITEVIPWLEMAYDLGLDLAKAQPAAPRAFKSHLSWHEIPKGGKYLVAIRDPKDALVSLYRFFEGWWFEPGYISLTEFANVVYMNLGNPHNYWRHLSSWWDHKDDPNVLLVCYEDMKDNLDRAIVQIADFIDVQLSPSLLEIVAQRASLEFMQAHKEKFDDHLLRNARDHVVGLPAGGDSNKVRTGRVGDHVAELTSQLSQQMDEIWQHTIESKYGFSSYLVLRKELAG